MLRNPCSRSCTGARDLSAPELARLDGEERGARRAAGRDPGGQRADRSGRLGRIHEPHRHDGCVARALGGDADVACELIVAERTGDQVQDARPDQLLLLAEEALAGLAHRTHPELVVEDEECRGLPRQGVARAGEDQPHPAAVADTLPELRPAGRVLRRVSAARAEADRLWPSITYWSPGPINPNESGHAERSQHGRAFAARTAR